VSCWCCSNSRSGNAFPAHHGSECLIWTLPPERDLHSAAVHQPVLPIQMGRRARKPACWQRWHRSCFSPDQKPLDPTRTSCQPGRCSSEMPSRHWRPRDLIRSHTLHHDVVWGIDPRIPLRSVPVRHRARRNAGRLGHRGPGDWAHPRAEPPAWVGVVTVGEPCREASPPTFSYKGRHGDLGRNLPSWPSWIWACATSPSHLVRIRPPGNASGSRPLAANSRSIPFSAAAAG
jgi:hypothetical protein